VRTTDPAKMDRAAPGSRLKLCVAADRAGFWKGTQPVLTCLFGYEGASANFHRLQSTGPNFFVGRCASDAISAAKFFDAQCAGVHLSLSRSPVDADVSNKLQIRRPKNTPEKRLIF
jgi:hypothetical protein